MRRIFIFDLDGTLALVDHRRHFVECPKVPGPKGLGDAVGMINDPEFKADWPAFYAACKDDAPNSAVIIMLQTLALQGFEIWVWTGRSYEVHGITEAWLDSFVGSHLIHTFKMRDRADFATDVGMKQSWLDAMTEADRSRVTAAFDDRDGVVEMWRRNGIPCFQVASGAF